MSDQDPDAGRPLLDDARASEERYRAFISNSAEGIWRMELDHPVSTGLTADEQIEAFYEHGSLAECNDAMARMYGYEKAEEIIGARLTDLLVRDDPANLAFLQAFISSGYRLTNAESTELDRAGQRKYFSNNMIGVVDDGFIQRSWGTQTDITERKHSEQRFAVLYGITRIAAEAATETAAADILKLICESMDWELGALWRVDKQANSLCCIEVWHQQSANLGDFSSITRNLVLAPGEGLPGAVWKQEKLIWLEDFLVAFKFPRAPAAAKAGIRAAVAFPLMLRSEVVGVIEFFSHDIKSPDKHLLELLSGIGNQIAQLIAREQTEQAQRESEERYRTLAETASDGIITADETSRILFANPAAGRIFGYELKELEDANLTMLMPDYLRNLHLHGIKRYAKTGKRHIAWDGVELPGLHKDGSEIPLEISFGESHANGKHVYTGIVRDISERRRAAAALLRSEQRYRTMADTAPVLIWEAGTDKLCYSLNQPWLDFTGRTMDQELGSGWTEGIHPDDCERCAAIFEEAFDARAQFSAEYRLRRADGEYRWVTDRGVPRFDADGTFIGFIGSVMDISERKEAEEERAQLFRSEQEARQKAEEASRLKDEFLATVSHELRTPLTAVVGWAHMLQSGQLDEQMTAGALDAITRNAKSQAQLIDDLLDVSRIITGRLRLDIRPADPVAFIEAAIEAVSPAAQAKGVRVQTVIDTGVGAVAGDPQRLQQVVWNLLSNAIRFTPRDGLVQVRLERVHSSIEIVVSDSGSGISLEFLPFVFDRFRQADMSTTRHHGGLGLGLSIVRHLTELHGGTVNAQSEGPGHGATFTVQLPQVGVYYKDNYGVRVHPAADALSQEPDPTERLDNLQVLVVDDERDTRNMLKAMLSEYGAEVTTAASAAEALSIFSQRKLDVLICDIGMPGEDGYEMIRKVRALPRDQGADIPALALTAYARREDQLQALRAGYQMHVPKPVAVNELVTIIASIVARAALQNRD
ncbi:MAG: PAS domain S-box protein [bacterium]